MNEANLQQSPPQPLSLPGKSTKTSLSELRNTDLVSRLLAATPPYLYNIPLTPNSYFFSEMLRSLVQAKAENSQRQPCGMSGVGQKRARKRSWTQSSRINEFQQHQQLLEESVNNKERPLELTMGKNLPTTSMSQEQQNFFANPQPSCDQNMMLPPVLPPVWYPPMYHPSNPTNPYGIDPLHFFIDLRVSGHIYDRKMNNHQEMLHSYQQNQNQQHDEEQQRNKIERTETDSRQREEENLNPLNYFRVNKHSSAFSVPNQKNPMNLSKFETTETKPTKFDVKSMGFEKNENKIGSHYITKNIRKIYDEVKSKEEENKVESKVEVEETNDEEEKEKKRVNDLRALIGLELVVDYMEHSKPNENKATFEDSSSTDVDDSVGSPSVDVEMCHDEETT
ncbi:uncharacterized protein [Onthophagus taurus]|uniref:uncharacterized protein n=1 Tax=Onthophagus taurus TaxID=166361 RepID=UPI000C1FDD32|nr:uncharacterized protein LOC111422470 [Onthophagus taurus]